MEAVTLLVAAAVLCFVYLWFRRPDPNLPPCPARPLPVVGHLFHIGNDLRSQLSNWRKQCGDIYSLYMGGTLLVVLSSYDLIKEALVKKADVFSDRPPIFTDMATGITDSGVVFSSGASWKEQRSTALSILRTFGMGKNMLADKIQEEVAFFLKTLKSLKGNPTDIRVATNISTSNIICSILIGHRFEYDDQEFQNLIHNMACIVEPAPVNLVNFIPWLKHLPGDVFKAKKITASIQSIITLMTSYINETRRQVHDPNDISNLIDAYLDERNKKNKAGTTTSLTDQSLKKIMFELFIAGTETSSTTLYWCILFMLNYPEVQEKVYQEIKDKIGTDRTPTMQDKSQLTYLNAVISETQRLSSITPLAVSHMCSEDVILGGYKLPKGTPVVPNLDAVLHDKDIWGDDALSFRPERFIDDSGKLKIPEQFIPFGAGRRVCLGEAMAKMELFLYLSSLFQTFRFLTHTPGSVPPLDCHFGAVVSPVPYKVRMVERK